MGALAGLLREAGHQVSGSDVAFYPPMGPALERWGIALRRGFSADHLDPAPDLVVVGNVCRRDNPEATAAMERGIPVTSMAAALRDHVLAGTSPLVVAGTHGKTTTTALCAFLLEACGAQPGFLVGGLPRDFDTSFRLAATGKRRLASGAARRTPFVIEGDEYDNAFFDKTPKFWHYRPEVAIVTSIEHDHVDIYPDAQGYDDAFERFVALVPADGLIVAHAADPRVAAIVSRAARARIAWYALESDRTSVEPVEWLAAPAVSDESGQSFDLFVGGSAAGRGVSALAGEHNLRNAVAALAACSLGFGLPLPSLVQALARFSGVARRQELLGTPHGVRIYDDFAHHPTAVRETLLALRRRHPQGRLWAIYEPRSATACRALHEAAYLEAFPAADHVILAPLGRDNVPAAERLDLDALARKLCARGVDASCAASHDAIVERLANETQAGDSVALLSNGDFGGVPRRVLERLRAAEPSAGTTE
jgi:UDP-N-acetylmuramate: L-alanyl-gamma-D-glutamyl-meso-diaminopimelate ligase